MAEIDIEGLLRSTAAATRWPAAPDVRAGVLRRVGEPALTPALSQRGEVAGLWTLMPRLVIAALLVAVVCLGAALVVEPSREAIARFFGVQGSRIEVLPPEAFPTRVVTMAPQVGGQATQAPLSALVGSGVAEAVELGVLAAETGFQPVLPQGFGAPQQAYVVRYGEDRIVALEYGSFELWQARLEGRATFGKGIPEGAIFEEVLVGGEPGYWLSGGPHFVSYDDRFGRYIPASSRLVEKSTLIWRTESAFYRIETDLRLEEAMRIAETLP